AFRFAGIEKLVAGAIDDHAVGTPQVLPAAEEHLARCTDERVVVDPDHEADGILAALRLGHWASFEETHGPADAVDTAHAQQIGVLERLRLFEIFGLRIHHPD